MRRREFITLFGVAALAGPRAARAQQADRVRRVGVLMSRAAGDPEEQARFAGFLQGLQKLGWTDGRNVRIDYRWAAADVPTALAHTRRRSGPAMSRGWRAQAATPPDLPRSNTASAENGWNCSKR